LECGVEQLSKDQELQDNITDITNKDIEHSGRQAERDIFGVWDEDGFPTIVL
jgi:hypothetical protein